MFSFGGKKDEPKPEVKPEAPTDSGHGSEAVKPGPSGVSKPKPQRQNGQNNDDGEDEDEDGEDYDDEEDINEEGIEGLNNQQVKGLQQLVADERKKTGGQQAQKSAVNEKKDRADSKASSVGGVKTSADAQQQQQPPGHVMGLKELMAAEREDMHKRKSDASQHSDAKSDAGKKAVCKNKEIKN